MAAAGVPVSAARSCTQASVSVGSTLSSANTAPDSTAASWSLSPSRMMRAAGGTASSRRVASARSSIEASSTTSASMGNGFAASCAKPAGVMPSRRWTVDESRGIFSRKASGRCCARWRMASVMRAAALPVGAASAMRQPGSSATRQASRLTTVVVLPVPGPPLITVSRPRSASAAASCCQSAAPPRRAALAANSSVSCARSAGDALAAPASAPARRACVRRCASRRS